MKILLIFWKQELNLPSIDLEQYPWYIREEKQALE